MDQNCVVLWEEIVHGYPNKYFIHNSESVEQMLANSKCLEYLLSLFAVLVDIARTKIASLVIERSQPREGSCTKS